MTFPSFQAVARLSVLSPLTYFMLMTLAFGAVAAPAKRWQNFERRQSACFIVGSETLPEETAALVDTLRSEVTCLSNSTTIGDVPDLVSNGIAFSSINFATSSNTPLTFALDTFATASPLADSDLGTFETELNLYLATEAGIRSEAGDLTVKIPKFFLAFQVARIKTAQGIDITDPGQTVEHLLGKVQSNAAGEDQSLLDRVTALSTELS